MRYFGVILFLFQTGLTAFATNPDSLHTSDNTSEIKINCFQRPAFFRINYRNLPAVRSIPQEYMDYNNRIESNRLIDAELNLPVILKPDFKLVTQLKYKNEDLNLGESQLGENEIRFKNAGILFGYQWFYKDEFFIAGHIGGALKAEKHDLSHLRSILDYNGSVVWGIDNGRFTAGAGILAGNSLGRFKILPLIVYEKQINKTWYIDAKLPKKLTVTKSLIPDDLYTYGSIEGEGATYFMNDHLLKSYDNIEYRRRSVDIKLGLEKELHDWMWAGLEIGITQPITSVLVEQGQPSRKNIHNFDNGFTPFVNLSLFVVPPRALYNRLTK